MKKFPTSHLVKGITLLSIFFLFHFLHANARKTTDAFIRIYPDKDIIYKGDSLLITVVLYSSFPIHQAKETVDFKSKGNCNIRPLNIPKDNSGKRTNIDGKVYYSLIWEQYVISPKDTGKFQFTSPQIKGTVREFLNMPNWIDQMMGVKPKFRDYPVKAKPSTYNFEVIEKPLRTTQEMMKYQIVI